LKSAKNQKKAFAIYTELADRGEFEAGSNLGICYEYGDGVPVDYKKAAAWYKVAAEHGSVVALYKLGGLYAKDLVLPRDDVEGLALLREAADRAVGDDPVARFISQDPSGYMKRLEERMKPRDISSAGLRASKRIEKNDPLGAAP